MTKQVVVVWLPDDRRINDIIKIAFQEDPDGVPLKKLYQRLQSGVGYREAIGILEENSPIISLWRKKNYSVYRLDKGMVYIN